MAQVNLTLNTEEILQLSSSNCTSDVFRELLRKTLNQFLEAESTEQIGAKPYERTEERTDSRNGSRERPLVTRIGTINLTVPRHRNEPFHTILFENYQRSEAALITTMAEMVIAGVSTRKVSKVMEMLCGKDFSKSTVSAACKQLDTEVERFRNKPIEHEMYPFIMLDATYFKVRRDHKIRSMSFMIAVGITGSGAREVLGFGLYDEESNSSWLSFVHSLKVRGLSGVMMCTSDAHPSIRYAMQKEYPDAVWQRCQFHFIRNILDAAPKSQKAGIEAEVREMFSSATTEIARHRRDEIIRDYSDVAEKAMDILENGFEDAMSIMMLPAEMRQPLRTSNAIERLNKELKRRSNVILIFPNSESILRLMGSVTIDYNDLLSGKKNLFHKKTISMITDEVKNKLVELAHDQAHRAEAA